MKRLVLDQQNRKISGLCAGIANYLDIDVTVIRLIVLVLTVMTGIIPGLFLYVIA
ncbi:MAG: PspC domain-containing protein, partial [Candidatus Saccharimonadales bacterium]